MEKILKPILLLAFLLLLAASAWALGPYVDNGDQTVTDQATGLMWDQRETSTKTWVSALAYCEGLDHAGHTDWRLPNRNELESLVDDTKYSPAIDTTAFPNAKSYAYQSSTTITSNATAARLVHFGAGSVGGQLKTYNYYVRCVR